MAQDCTLYFFPGSYYSLKALLALYEKQVPFKENIVNIYNGEQNGAWFLKLNPKGQVPVLKHGDRSIPDSEDIIDYVDSHWTAGPKLVPDVESPTGQEVQRLRKLLHDVPVGKITFGVLSNRNFCTSDLKFPPNMKKMLTREGIAKRFNGNIDKMKAARKKASGELQAELTKRIESSTGFLSAITDEESVADVLDDLEKVFDEIEDRLEKSRKEANGGENYWLVGLSFTVADIIATVLIYRLSLIGIENRYFSDTKRIIVKNYYDRLRQRPTVKKTIAMAETFGPVMMKAAAWKVVKTGLVVGAVLVGVWFAREVFLTRKGLRRV